MKLYVFLTRRPIDSQAWPNVFTDRERAEKAYGRVSDVVEVEVEDNQPPQNLEQPK